MMKKKKNAYLNTILWMVLGAIGGGILGILGFRFYRDGFGGMMEGGETLFSGLQQIALPLMIIIMLITVLSGEMNLKKQRLIGEKILASEDEECDQWEYELEKVSARGTIANTISQILSVLVLSVCYSMDYISEGNAKNALAICIAFVVSFFYDNCWQIRFVKHTQKLYPQMQQADVSSGKFNEQWLKCCDEAEKEYIYQSAYQCYQKLGKIVPSLLFIALLGHLFFDTGIMAIVMVAVIWLVLVVSYLRSCVKLKGSKLNR